MVEQVAKEYQGKVKTLQASVEDTGDRASDLGILGIPALVFFKGGQEVSRLVGPVPKKKITDTLKAKLGV